MSVELHPPVDIDKGTVVADLAADADSALYAGDDVGDLPAFAALDALAARGGATSARRRRRRRVTPRGRGPPPT